MPLILGTNSIKDTGFNVANSLRFNSGSSDDLVRTPDSQSTTKFTWSAWVKRGNYNAFGLLFNERQDSNNFTQAFWEDGSPVDALSFQSYKSGSYHYDFKTNRLFRDPSAWYHIIFILDTTLGTQSDRIKIYVNGVRETSFHTSTNNINQNDTLSINSGVSNSLKIGSNGSSGYFYGYMCEVVYVSNNALAHTDLGEFDEDSPQIWKPKDVSGLTFGTAGYYLDFENSGALGADVSGNSNNFTVNNLTAVDQSTDTCTNNFCTWNPLIVRIGRTQPTFSEGNIKCQHNDTGGPTPSWGTFLLNSGKWYWEVKITSAGIIYCGVWQPGYNNGNVSDALDGIVIYRQDGNKQAETAATTTSYGNSFTTGDILGIAVDVDTGTIWFSKNGTWQNSATQSEIEAGTTTNSAYTGKSFATNGIVPSVSAYQHNGNAIVEANFGGGTSFSISSGNTDGNGYGNFEYAVPSGYYSLNTKNLAEFG